MAEQTQDDSSSEEEFGYHQPIIKSLRTILRLYPGNGQILKEIIQNAEDARARRVCFMVDWNTYVQDESLLEHPDLKQFQGPALLAYNDASFTTEDWKGLQSLHASLKEDDPSKIGQFGLGFKSVYHLTDLPSVLSGKSIGYFDPHERYFKTRDGNVAEGKKYKFARTPEIIQHLCHQFQPFNGKYGCQIVDLPREGYNGTLFRFPLRQKASKLCSSVHTRSSMKQLFDSFISDADTALLFLHHVEEIELQWLEAGKTEPRCYYKVKASSQDRASADRNGRTREVKPHRQSVVFPLEITRVQQNGQSRAMHWLISEVMASSSLAEQQNHVAVPVVGVAMPLDVREVALSGTRGALNGQLFCYLPLSAPDSSGVVTGLPVHVNGTFSTSPDRHHILMPSAGQTWNATDDLAWNEMLREILLPVAYQNLIVESVHLNSQPNLELGRPTVTAIMSALPNLERVQCEWTGIAKQVMRELMTDKAVLYTDYGNGCWVKASQALLEDSSADERTRQILYKLALKCHLKVIRAPVHVCNFLVDERLCQQMSPNLLAKVLPCHPQECQRLTTDEKHHLLAYLLQQEGIDLEGLPLLPTADNQFIAFMSRSNKLIYNGSESHPSSLLRHQESLLLSPSLPSSLQQMLSRLARSEIYQLRELDLAAVVSHLPNSIPATWKSMPPAGLRRSRSDADVAWLYDVWTYVASHPAVDLHDLEGQLPLLDEINTSTVTLHQLRKPSLLMLYSERLDQTLCDTLKIFHFQMLTNIPRHIAARASEYLCPAKPRVVIDHLAHFHSADDMISMLSRADTNLKITFQKFMSKACDAFSAGQIRLLECLPIFQLEGDADQFVSVRTVREACLNKPQILLNVSLLDLTCETTRRFAQCLGAAVLSDAAYLKAYVFPKMQSMSDRELKIAVDFIILNWGLLQQDLAIIHTLKKLKFVPTNTSGLVCPKDLFNPSDPCLVQLFMGDNKFPAKWMMERQYLSFLEQLGLKSLNDVTSGDLVETAQTVARLQASANAVHLEKKAGTILQILSSQPSLMVSELNTIPWLPVLDKPQSYPAGLEWGGAEKWVLPDEVGAADCISLAGSVLPLCKLPDLPSVIGYHMGSDAETDVRIITSHLRNIIRNYTAAEKDLYLAMVACIYRFLASCDLSKVHENLQNDGWIWQGDGFAYPTEICLEQPVIKLHPYMYVLPCELQQVQQLFEASGVHAKCGVVQLVAILRRIGEKWVEEEAQQSSQKDDLQIVQHIVEELSRCTDEMDEATRLAIPIPVMEADGVRMYPLKETTCSAVAAIYQTEADDSDHIIHPCISLPVAISLNIKRLDDRIVGAEGLEFMHFGQTESLTNRLRNILGGYQDGVSVFKELVQNADDAKATVVKFLWDERKNLDCNQNLLSPGMSLWHGPALWAYNDAVFTEQDYENIKNLGAGNKRTDLNKIGKFGLGFNAVYNLTDVPSFVSQGDIVIFDPHLVYLGEQWVKENRPGVRIPFAGNSRLTRIHGDQLQPFQGIFECHIMNNQEFDGTLFRFPLRSKETARRSEFCHQVYDRNHMEKLCRMFIENASEMLLFTQSVQEMELYHLPEEAQNPQDAVRIFKVSKNTTKTLTSQGFKAQKQRILDEAAHIFHASGPLHGLNKTEVITIESELTVKNEQDGCIPLDMRTGEQNYLVSHWLGQEDSRNKAAHVAQMGLTPLGSVAMPVSFDGVSYKPSTLEDIGRYGKVFCYLPLPLSSGLPVHINGSFAVHSDRCRISERSEDCTSNTEAEWNEALLGDAVAEAYIQLLHSLDTVCQQSDTEILYCDFWPDVVGAAPCVLPLVTAMYRKMAARPSTPVVYRSKTVSIADAQFISDEVIQLQFARDGLKGEIHEAVALCDPGAVFVSETVLHSFRKAGSGQSIRNLNLQEIYTQLILGNLHVLPAALRDTLIAHALQRLDDAVVNSEMERTACIPVEHAESTLKKPSALVQPRSTAGELFSTDDLRFPAKSFCSPKLLTCLVELGMQESLTWPSLLERAASIKDLYEKDTHAAVDRCAKLLKLMGREGNCPADLIQTLMSVEFLPATGKPAGHPLPWKWMDDNSNPKLVSAESAYLSEHLDLVSASHPVVYNMLVPTPVKHIFGLTDKQPAASDVVFQLITLAESPITSETAKVAVAIYRYLDDICQSQEETASVYLQEALADKAFIFIEDRFYSPINVTSPNLMHDCPPYLCKLPTEYTEHGIKKFLHVMGYRDDVNIMNIIDSLQSLEHAHHDNKLSDRDRRLVINLLEILAKEMKNSDWCSSDIESDIFMPNWEGILRPSKSLCFVDVKRLTTIKEVDEALTHLDVAPNVALMLGVQTQKDFFLQSQMKVLPFGQREDLITRLRHIVDSYPFDTAILKELLQNADDAGATSIHFILDKRTHEVDNVFSEHWKELQGPALLVYNNKPFTDDDLEGIQNLGTGTKSMDPTKTGQYGIGFNAVYHLTDVPCFITQIHGTEKLCIFDPCCKYLPSATKDSPGGLFEVLKQHRDLYPDVFGALLPDLVPVKNATLFRFPLRKDSTSKIKKEATSCDKVEGLLESFKEEAVENLLFLQSLKEVKLSKIDTAGKLQQLFFCTVDLTEEDEKERLAFKERAKTMMNSVKEKIVGLESLRVFQTLYHLNIKVGKMSSKWLITQQVGFTKFIDNSSMIKEAFESGKMCLSPRAGTAVCLKSRSQQNVDASCKDVKGKIYCMLPTAEETHISVHINGHFALGFEDRRKLWRSENDYKHAWNELLFTEAVAPCFVTMLEFLSISLTQDLHADDQMNFQCTCQALECHIDQYFKRWPSADNGNHIKSLAKSVYAIIADRKAPLLPVVRRLKSDTKLKAVKQACMSNNSTDEDTESDASHQENWSLSWMACSDPLQPAYYWPKGEKKKNSQSAVPSSSSQSKCELKQILRDIGFDVLYITKHGRKVVHNLKEVTDRLVSVTPAAVRDFLRTYDQGGACCLQASLPASLTDTPIQSIDKLNLLIDYCLTDSSSLDDLVGLPLLARWDEQLHVFKKQNEEICTTWYHLFPELQSRFLHPGCIRKFSLGSSELNQYMTNMDVDVLSQLLSEALPPAATCNHPVELDQLKDQVTTEWLAEIWNCIASMVEESQLEEESQRKDHFTFLEPLWGFSLVCGSLRDKMILYPVGHARQLISSEAANHDVLKPVAEHLPLTCLPWVTGGEVELVPLRCGISDAGDVLCEIVTSPSNPLAVLKILHSEFQGSGRPNEEQGDHASKVLEYFSDNLSVLEKHADDSRQLLCELPVYETVSGKRVAFRSAMYAVPDVPPDGIDELLNRCDIGVLKAEHLENLFKFLGCEILTVSQFYNEILFKHLEVFENGQRMRHWYFIHNEWQIERKRKKPGQIVNVFHELRRVPFISVHSKQFQCASEFRDPENKVYKLMEPQKMPPGVDKTDCFILREWHNFLRACGMKTDCDYEELLQYAKQIESEARCGGKDKSSGKSIYHRPVIEEKSQELIKYIYSRFKEEFLSAAQLAHIGSIRFVPPKVNRKEWTGYVSFSESYDKEYADLVWTQAPLIDFYMKFFQKGKEFRSALGMKDEPPVDVVVCHLQEITLVEEHLTDVTLSQRVDIFTQIFTYLQNHSEELTDAQAALISNLACVPVAGGQYMVPPSDTVLNLTDEQQLQPYLYRMPGCLGSCETLMLRLGATPAPTIKQYVRVLSRVYRDCKKDRSGYTYPPQDKLIIVDEAMTALIHLLHQHRGEINTSDFTGLCFLSQSYKLIPSEHLIVNDAPGFRERLRNGKFEFLDDTDRGVQTSHLINALGQLPARKRPNHLRQVLAEKMSAESKAHVETDHTSQKLQCRLRRAEFQNGIARLVSHYKHHTGKQPDVGHTRALAEKIGAVTVKSVPLHWVESGERAGLRGLQTCLVHAGEMIPGSERETNMFAEKVNGKYHIYLSATGDKPLSAYQLLHVATVVKDMVDSEIPDASDILHLLECDMEEIDNVLDSMNILRNSDCTQISNTQSETVVQEIGSCVPSNYRQRLRALTAGDVLLRGQIVAAVVVPKLGPKFAAVLGERSNRDQEVLIDVGRPILMDRKSIYLLPESIFSDHLT